MTTKAKTDLMDWGRRCTGIRPEESRRKARQAGEELAKRLAPAFEALGRMRKLLAAKSEQSPEEFAKAWGELKEWVWANVENADHTIDVMERAEKNLK